MSVHRSEKKLLLIKCPVLFVKFKKEIKKIRSWRNNRLFKKISFLIDRWKMTYLYRVSQKTWEFRDEFDIVFVMN